MSSTGCVVACGGVVESIPNNLLVVVVMIPRKELVVVMVVVVPSGGASAACGDEVDAEILMMVSDEAVSADAAEALVLGELGLGAGEVDLELAELIWKRRQMP